MEAIITSIKDNIIQFYKEILDDRYHRYCSWEHCYLHFRRLRLVKSNADIATATLHLAFYLASWGMPTLHVSPTDTLVTKVLLGTLGCIPAYDTFFINGVTCWSGITYPVMKLADMYFWSLGYQLRTLNAHQSRKR